MSRTEITLIASVVVLLLGAYIYRHQGVADDPIVIPSAAPVPAENAEPESASDAAPTATVKGSEDFRFERLPDGRSLVTEAIKSARELHSPQASPEADLEAVDSIFSLYRWAYKENPEGGDNRELVSALTGENPRKLVFIPGDHPSLSASGELLDRWGTPYFFHKISDQVIDVTSAGPDRRLWSRDDLTLGYTETYQAATSNP